METTRRQDGTTVLAFTIGIKETALGLKAAARSSGGDPISLSPSDAISLGDMIAELCHDVDLVDSPQPKGIQEQRSQQAENDNNFAAVLLSLLFMPVGFLYKGHLLAGVIWTLVLVFVAVATAGVGLIAGIPLALLHLCSLDAR